MPEFIDLSQTIDNNIPIYPGDTPFKLSQDKFLTSDQYTNFRIDTGMHVGTHIDTPMHMIDNKIFISDIALDNFTGIGRLLDVRNQKTITYHDEYVNKFRENDIVLLYTGQSALFGKDAYFESYPVVDDSFAEFLISKKIKILGIDSPSPDIYPFGIHKKLFNKGILIIENLCNLNSLKYAESFEIFAFPLKINADASLLRVVAKIESH